MTLNKFQFNQLRKEGKIVRRFTDDGKMGWYYKNTTPGLVTESWLPIAKAEKVKEINRIYNSPDNFYPGDLLTKDIWEKLIINDRIRFIKAMGMN